MIVICPVCCRDLVEDQEDFYRCSRCDFHAEQLTIETGRKETMKAEAIAKLKAEMHGNASDGYIQFVGDQLLSHLEKCPQDADKILTADKTIGKSLAEMEKAARSKKTGNMAMLTPTEGMEVVFNYFGIQTAAAIAAAPASSGSAFNVSLDDLMEG